MHLTRSFVFFDQVELNYCLNVEPQSGYFRRKRSRDDGYLRSDDLRDENGDPSAISIQFDNVSRVMFAHFLFSVFVLVPLSSLIALPRKAILDLRRFRLNNQRFDGKHATQTTSLHRVPIKRVNVRSLSSKRFRLVSGQSKDRGTKFSGFSRARNGRAVFDSRSS